MAKYIDCFVMPVPAKKLQAYRKVAKISAAAWVKAGALEYHEWAGDDVPKGKLTSFPMSVKLKAGEKVVVGMAVYKSRAHRDKVMAKLHEDESMLAFWDNLPFDGMRMIWGGFETLV